MVRKVLVVHNILWSRYKATVFSKVHEQASNFRDQFEVRFVQIAETENDRIGLSTVDLSRHNYPYDLLFSGSYEQIPAITRILTLVRLVWRCRPDLVVLPGYDKPEYWGMLAAAKILGSRTSVFCDSTARDRHHHWHREILKHIFFRTCGSAFCYGERSREYALTYGAAASKVYVRCQASDIPDDYSFSSEYERVKEQKAPKIGLDLLYVGRLAPEKGLDLLLQAMAQLKESQPPLNVTLKLIGSGPIENEIQKWISSKGLTEDVSLVGALEPSEIAAYYRTADALILPSTSEPWGLVVNEAFSYGCPAVVSDACGCVPDLIIEGKTGYSFVSGSASSLVEKILILSEVSQTKGTRGMSMQCLSTIQNYSPEVAAKQILTGVVDLLK